jgi:phosphatidylserine/phosphatidylglycerophosphate/cardiolipin synthase-like enzyme
MHTREATFGYHPLSSFSTGSVEQQRRDSAIKKKSILIRTSVAVSLIGLSIIALFACLPPFAALFAGALVLGTCYIATKIYRQSLLSKTAGIIFNRRDIKPFKLTPKYGKCEAIPTEHSADTELWRKKLIKSAEENIVISGNYCGGNAFVDFLDLIEKRIEARPNLKVVIISSPHFINGKCKKRLEEILRAYPNNVSLIESPSIAHLSPGIKRTTNHTKCMVIDYGRYFILGGNGIKDNFATTGLDDLSKEEFLESQGEIPTYRNESPASGVLARVLPGSFRDQDFVFSSKTEKNPVGVQVYKQMLLLAHKWEVYNRDSKHFFIKRPKHISVSGLGLFTGTQTPISQGDSITTKLLKTPPKALHNSRTRVEKFERSAKKAGKVFCKVFASGPEATKSPFAGEILDQIKKAKKRIVINQMYFHPTTEIRDALIWAARRGVKIEILTCGVHETSPASHSFFGPRNKYNYSYIMNSLTPDERRNVSIYEMRGRKIGNHKKIIIFDDETVIAGSSNFGYKSLVTCSDHELNFIARSKKFAEETLKVYAVDLAHSKRVTRAPSERWSMTLKEHFTAIYHRLMAPLIG